MRKYVLTVKNESKANHLIEFLKDIDFIEINDFQNTGYLKTDILDEIKESISDFKSGQTSSWKDKKIFIKDEGTQS